MKNMLSTMDGADVHAQIPLDHIPESRRITGTFGFQGGTWGIFFIVVLILMLAGSGKPPTLFEMEIYIVLFIAGAGSIAWETARRRHPTVLVEQDGMIAVYRKRYGNIVVSRDRVRCEKVDLIIIIKIGAPLLMCTILFTAIAVAIIGDEKRITAETLILLSFGLALGASLMSAAWTTFFRKRLLVPVEGSRWIAEQTVLVPRGQCKRLFARIGEV